MDHFPARGRSRAIHDASAAPIRLLPIPGAPSALDLSQAGLRGASEDERRALRELRAASCLLLPVADLSERPLGEQRQGLGLFHRPQSRRRLALNGVAGGGGAFCRIFLPASWSGSATKAGARPLRIEVPARPEPASKHASTLSILIVEDEWLIAQDLEASLIERGAAVVANCATAEQALRCLEETRPDAAALDLTLRDGSAAPVAAALRQMGVPFIFATGHGDHHDLLDEFADVPVVVKPYDGKSVLDAVTRAMARRANRCDQQAAAWNGRSDFDLSGRRFSSQASKLFKRERNRPSGVVRSSTGAVEMVRNPWTKKNPLHTVFGSAAQTRWLAGRWARRAARSWRRRAGRKPPSPEKPRAR